MSAADLRDAVRTIARLSRTLERSCGELTLPQYRLLAMVEQGDERSSALAERLAVAKPTVTAMVDGLVERGLLTREVVAGDRRAVRVAITPAGRRSVRSAEAKMGERLQALLVRVDDPPAVLEALACIRQAMDEAVAELFSGAAK